MRGRPVLIALGALAIASVVAGAVYIATRPAPDGPGVAVAGNALQPLADDLTWIYRPRGGNDLVDATDRLVISIVGRQTVGSETEWLLEYNVGEGFATRLVLVERGGELWIVGIDSIEGGTWMRSVFDEPQLYQPGPGARTWEVDYRDAPEIWRMTATWEQRASGQLEVLGRSGNAWQLIGDIEQGGSRSRETDVAVEGIGLVSITTVAEGFSLRLDLERFGLEIPELEGRYRTTSDGEEQILRVLNGVATADGDIPVTVDGWQVDGDKLTFRLDGPNGSTTWTGRITPAGWIGTAKGPGGVERVVEFARLLDD